MDYLINILIAIILLVLFSALYHLMPTKKRDPKKLLRLLALRIGLSMVLLITLAILASQGYIEVEDSKQALDEFQHPDHSKPTNAP